MMGFTDQQALNVLVEKGIVIRSRTIGEITFTGSGLNDMTNGGEFTGNSDIEYEVEIDGTGTPDTFKWSKGVPGGILVEQETLVPITGLDQTLADGVTIKFDATTGHVLGEKWAFTARFADPTSIQKSSEQLISVSLAPGPATSKTSDAIDLRNVELASLSVMCDYAVGAVAGSLVEIFTSHDNINYDNDAWASTGLEPALSAGNTKQRTSNLDVEPISYAKVKITNLDAVKSLANIFVTMTKVRR